MSGSGGLANPGRFLRMCRIVIPCLGVLTVAMLVAGLYAVSISPPDYRQGVLVRILYLHVPLAWLSLIYYGVVCVSALGILVWRHPLAYVSVKAALPTGCVLSASTLLSGAIWGYPTWGTFWAWDARLTSMLVLFLLYVGLISLSSGIADESRGGRMMAILALVGFVDVPIIKFSVDWWSTLHQPASVLRMEGSALHPSMMWPLVLMFLALTVFSALLQMMAMRNEVLRHRVERLGRILAFEKKQS